MRKKKENAKRKEEKSKDGEYMRKILLQENDKMASTVMTLVEHR